MSVAMTMAKALGATEFAVSCLPDAAPALAMYAAAAGLKAHVFVPSEISKTNYVAATAAGAIVTLADGSLDFAKVMEPYRIEGEKTIGFEIAEQFAWSLPEAILLPSGAGEVAISKAFRELEQLGWIEGKRPKIIAITTENRRANVDAALELARTEGIFVSPEGGACIAALRDLLQSGVLKASDRVVVLNPSSGFKHIGAYGTRFIRAGSGEQDKLGGLITPR
jgi:threonine synthase